MELRARFLGVVFSSLLVAEAPGEAYACIVRAQKGLGVRNLPNAMTKKNRTLVFFGVAFFFGELASSESSWLLLTRRGETRGAGPSNKWSPKNRFIVNACILFLLNTALRGSSRIHSIFFEGFWRLLVYYPVHVVVYRSTSCTLKNKRAKTQKRQNYLDISPKLLDNLGTRFSAASDNCGKRRTEIHQLVPATFFLTWCAARRGFIFFVRRRFFLGFRRRFMSNSRLVRLTSGRRRIFGLSLCDERNQSILDKRPKPIHVFSKLLLKRLFYLTDGDAALVVDGRVDELDRCIVFEHQR